MPNTSLVHCPIVPEPGKPYPAKCINEFGFQFSSLWTIIQNIWQANPNDPRLAVKSLAAASRHLATLTPEACYEIAGNGKTSYSASEIWARLTIWKFPLLQLAAVFSRPPLGRSVEALVFFRLLGNPIGTIRGLTLKYATTQSRALFFQHAFAKGQALHGLTEVISNDPKDRREWSERLWKAFAMIMDCYDEWGYQNGSVIRGRLYEKMRRAAAQPVESEQRKKFLLVCIRTADALAADRSTAFVAIWTALAIYVGTTAISFGRDNSAAADLAANPSLYLNIEAHSVAYTALFFWIITAALMGAFVGASQSERAMRRILGRFESELLALPDLDPSLVPNSDPNPDPNPDPNLNLNPSPNRPGKAGKASKNIKAAAMGDVRTYTEADRRLDGGVYSWQIRQGTHWLAGHVRDDITTFRRKINNLQQPGWALSAARVLRWLLPAPTGSYVFATLLVFLCAATGMLISALVPPYGVSCRHKGQLGMFGIWLLSAVLDFVPVRRVRLSVVCHLVKEVVLTLTTVAIIMVTQWGIYNSCDCYTMWGSKPLQMPEMQPIAGVLAIRIRTMYPGLAFGCIAIMLVVAPALLVLHYRDALRVYLQNDQGELVYRRAFGLAMAHEGEGEAVGAVADGPRGQPAGIAGVDGDGDRDADVDADGDSVSEGYERDEEQGRGYKLLAVSTAERGSRDTSVSRDVSPVGATVVEYAGAQNEGRDAHVDGRRQPEVIR